MPDVRYYDYGVMRREANRRIYDAQRRAGREGEIPTRRVTPEYSVQDKACPEPVPEQEKPVTCVQEESGREEAICTEEKSKFCAESKTVLSGINAEELLIIALLMLTLSEGRNLPLALVLLYLLI